MRLAHAARLPDLLFVAREHLDRLERTRLAGPADLVVEVISDDSVARDQVEKFAQYAAAGVPEYWLVDPRPGQEWAKLYALTAAGRYDEVSSDEQGRLHSRVVPGFWLDPAWLWQDPPPSLQSLQERIAAG